MKRLSVIIPGYNNRFDWWERCVKSVLAATMEEDELICVDDGSPNQDELKRLVAGGIWENKRIRWIWREKNGGLAAARNSALDEVKGSYVTFIDSDDEILPDTYTIALQKLATTGADVCIFGVKTLWTKEGLAKSDTPGENNFGKLSPLGLKELVHRRIFNYAWNKIYKADFIAGRGYARDRLRFDVEGMPCEDAIFNLECLMCGAKYCSVDVVGYVYYRTTSTLLSSYKKTNREGCRKNSDKWLEYCTKEGADIAPYRGWAILSESDLMRLEWANLWMRGSPYSYWSRLMWIRDNAASCGTKHPFCLWTLFLVKTFVRRFFYIRCFRIWHLKRTFGASVARSVTNYHD